MTPQNPSGIPTRSQQVPLDFPRLNVDGLLVLFPYEFIYPKQLGAGVAGAQARAGCQGGVWGEILRDPLGC